MRIAPIVLLAATACGGAAPSGLYVQLSGSAASEVASIEVIAAGSATLEPQRTSDVVGMTGSAIAIPYYVQLDTTGAIVDPSGAPIDVSSYTLRLEPDPAIPLDSFVPIVLARNADHAIVAVGVFEDADDDAPANAAFAREVAMDPTIAARVDVTMEPALAVPGAADDTHPGPGTLRTFACTSATPSGHVWIDAHGRELRLLLPIDGSRSASSRSLDIDCDQVAVTTDCDDTDSDINPNVPEGCTGLDASCAYPTSTVVVEPCTSSPACPGAPGRQLCDERTSMASTCVAPTCDLDSFESCTAAVTTSGGPGETLCMPATGELVLPDECRTPVGCTMQVDGATGGLTALLGTANGGPFGSAVQYSGDGSVFIQIALAPTATSLPAQLGIVDLIVRVGATATYHGVVVQSDATRGCAAVDANNVICIPNATTGN